VGTEANVLHLCYMKRRPSDRVGVRDLRQNLSVYLRRIQEDGASYEVTDRGEPVARLVPLADQPASRYQLLVAEGRITPAARPWSTLPPPLPSRPGPTLSEVLREMRDEEAW
jgi:prevent-host-death family protein